MSKLKKFRVEIYREVSNRTTGFLYAENEADARENAEDDDLEDENVEIGDCTFIECNSCEEVEEGEAA